LQAVGSIAVLADGVGGEGNGDIASRLAAETALEIFKEAKPETSTNDSVRRIFDESAAKIFQAAQKQGRMSTTLLTAIFSRRQGHHCARRRFPRLPHPRRKNQAVDHRSFYTSLQVKLGLLLERNAMTSEHRSTLTRSVGSEPICHYDISTVALEKDDILLQCSDGLYVLFWTRKFWMR